MSVTIKQIALRAGLSVPTVSRILNNDSELFRPETRDKVLAAARDLGYRPNSYRMALRTKKFNAIGLLYGESFPCQLGAAGLNALVAELHRTNQHLVVGSSPTSAEGLGTDDAATPKMLREWSVDGMLVPCPVEPMAELLELVTRNKIPTIWLNCKREADCAYADQTGGVGDAVRRLLGMGHRRVAFANLSGRHCVDEYAGYRGAMESAGLDGRAVSAKPIAATEQFAFLVNWLRAGREAGDAPTAVFCADADGATALHAAALAAGLKVPGDLSIVAASDAAVVGTGVAISTVRRPDAAVCREGLAALGEKMVNAAMNVTPRVVPTTFEAGATTAAVRG